MPPTLSTERLTLRPLTEDDVPALHRIYSDARAMRFMPVPPLPDAAATWGIGLTAEGGPIIGVVNLLGETAVPGLGYIVHPDYWGRGIATEATRAALDYVFGTLGLDRVELWIDERNAASRRVADRLGFRVRGQLAQTYAHETTAHVMLVYGLWAAEWRGDVAPAALRGISMEPVLPVRDVAASLAFYTQVLGFRVAFTWGDPVEYAGVTLGAWSGGVSIHLDEAPAGRAINPSGAIFIGVQGDFDALYQKAQGHTIIAPLATQPWGMREFTIADPDGHRLRFATPG